MNKVSWTLIFITALTTLFCISEAGRAGLKGRPTAPVEAARSLAKSMAKAKKRRRNQAFNQGNIDQGGGSKAPAANDAGDVSDSGSDGNTISDAEIRTTLRVLSTLGADMETFRSRRMKELRVAVNPLVEERLKQMAGAGLGAAGTPSLSGKVSSALSEKRWEDAIVLLETMRKPRECPKLGAVQRWVRDCDLGATCADDPKVLEVLDGIMRTCGQVWAGISAAEVAAGEEETSGGHPAPVPHSGSVRTYPPWVPVARRPLPEPTVPDFSKEGVRVVGFEKGEDRRPPNRHDLHMWATQPGAAVTFDEVKGTARHDFPFVPGAFVLSDVLSDNECAQMIAASEAMGFTPDEPVDKAPDARAVGCVWVVDESILNPIYARIEKLLTQELGGGKVSGLNARWRLYRYSPGNVYRPHVDGAWPGSGLDDEDRYVYDKFGDRWSKLTFIIYLTDDFEGGSTTFFTPARVPGCLEARGVMPSRGSVMVFPHGDAMGALVHEGSAVHRGMKYIIRSDVLYKGAEAEADVAGVDNKKFQRHMKVNSNDRWALNK